MNVLLKYSAILGSMLFANELFAQSPMNSDRATTEAPKKEYVNTDWRPSLVPDGMIDRVENRVNRTLEWHNVREIDIAYKRRLWRRIDIREKQNMPFIFEGDEYTGGGAFVEILIDAVKRGKIRAFQDDRFTAVLSYEDIQSKLMTTEDVEITDAITGETRIERVQNTFNPQNVAMYEVQEDYMFDRNVGRPVSRLRSITANFAVTDPNTGEFRNWSPLFTIYYPEARNVLSQFEVYNPTNDLHRMSWSDYLDRMMYNAYVVKTSYNNPTGERFQNGGVDALMKGQREMESMIQRDMDMWEL